MPAVLPVIENVALVRIFFSSRAAIPVLWGHDIPPKGCPLEFAFRFVHNAVQCIRRNISHVTRTDRIKDVIHNYISVPFCEDVHFFFVIGHPSALLNPALCIPIAGYQFSVHLKTYPHRMNEFTFFDHLKDVADFSPLYINGFIRLKNDIGNIHVFVQ